MSSYRKLVAGAALACLLPATGAAIAAVHADFLEAEAAAVPARPTVETPPPAPPALPATAEAPAPAMAPAPAPRADPEPRAPSRTASSRTTDAQLNCLARVILYEAGNQSRAGQLAVAQVVMNRVRSPRFPNTICGVVMQRGQFSNIRGFRAPGGARWRRALDIARDARAGTSAPVVSNALFFRATYANPGSFRSHTRVATVGDHVFYR